MTVVGTGISSASSTTATEEEKKVDVAAVVAKEKEEMKIPEEERKLMESMSDIEKGIIEKQKREAKEKQAEKEKAEKDFSWWKYDDPQTYFCVSTKEQYSFKPGQQIFTSYGRRSNKFLLTFYGFCIADNRHDSVVMRIRRSIDQDSRLTTEGIVEQLVLTREEIETGYRREIEMERLEALNPDEFEWPEGEKPFSETTKGIQLKHNKLNLDLMAYLRAHLLLFYEGEDICNVRVTVPTEIDYEILVLKTYRSVLDRFKELNPGRFDAQDEEEILIECETTRADLIRTYRLEQCRIISAQYSIVNTLLLVCQQIKLIGLTYTYAINQLCVGHSEHLVNCLNMRKYLKQLFAPQEAYLTPSEDSGDEDEAEADYTDGADI